MAGRSEPGRILVIDDEAEIVGFVRELLSLRGHRVEVLSDSRRGSDVFRDFQPDLCVLDYQMPYVSGSELLDAFKKADPTVQVIFLTGQDETLLAVSLMKRGAFDFLLKPIELNQLSLSVERGLEHRRLVRENEAYRQSLETLVAVKTEALNEALHSLTHVHSATLDALALALDFRDQSTSGHSRRVADLTTGAARRHGVTGDALVQIQHGALLHDIGKLKIPDSILWKPASLDKDEWVTMRKHPEYGYDFLRNIEFLRGAADLVFSHHEKYDGSGYPRQLEGESIPFGARIFAIVDAVDAMIYKRPYNTPVSFQEAADEVRRCSGTHFDPRIVPSILQFLDENVPGPLKG
jgi:putative nucleotidyltransferase with HDIG domain